MEFDERFWRVFRFSGRWSAGKLRGPGDHLVEIRGQVGQAGDFPELAHRPLLDVEPELLAAPEIDDHMSFKACGAEDDLAVLAIGRVAPLHRFLDARHYRVHAFADLLKDRPRERLGVCDVGVDPWLAFHRMPPPSISRITPMRMTKRFRFLPALLLETMPITAPMIASGMISQFAQPSRGMNATSAQMSATTPMTSETKLNMELQLASLGRLRETRLLERRHHVKHKRGPDGWKGDRMRGRERLSVKEHRDEELERRREELEHAERRISKAFGGGGEQQQRRRRDDAREQQQSSLSSARADHGLPGERAPAEPCGREREEYRCFHCEAGQRIGGDHLAKESVEREADAKCKAHPQLAEGPGCKNADPRRCNRDRRPLQPAQPLVEHEPAEKHVCERVQIIAEARRQDVAAGDGINVKEPVKSDE